MKHETCDEEKDLGDGMSNEARWIMNEEDMWMLKFQGVMKHYGPRWKRVKKVELGDGDCKLKREGGSCFQPYGEGRGYGEEVCVGRGTCM